MSETTDKPTTIQVVEMIFPNQANHYGTLFAGNGLVLMAKAAVVAATRRSNGSVVLARTRDASFSHPVKVGDLLELTAEIVRIGRSSMTVVVRGVAQSMASGDRRDVLQGQFEMVAVNEDGRPRAIEVPESVQDHQVREETI